MFAELEKKKVSKSRAVKRENVIQRVVNTANAERSENGNYIINKNDRSKLYSLTTAVGPVPNKLYMKTEDQDEIGSPLCCWKPNVRLFSNAEHTQIATKTKQTVPSDALWGLAGSLGFKKQVYQYGLEKGMIDRLRTNIHHDELQNRGHDLMGIIGKNDCGEFASYLQNLIGAGDDKPQNMTPRKDDLETRVGDKMKYTFKSDEGCPYHYATIVAADGESKVTLEANAGLDLTQPEFNIRNGIQGFIDDNNKDEKEKVTLDEKQNYQITKLDKSKDDYTRAMSNSALNPDINNQDPSQKTYRTKGGREITSTVAGIFKDK